VTAVKLARATWEESRSQAQPVGPEGAGLPQHVSHWQFSRFLSSTQHITCIPLLCSMHLPAMVAVFLPYIWGELLLS